VWGGKEGGGWLKKRSVYRVNGTLHQASVHWGRKTEEVGARELEEGTFTVSYHQTGKKTKLTTRGGAWTTRHLSRRPLDKYKETREKRREDTREGSLRSLHVLHHRVTQRDKKSLKKRETIARWTHHAAHSITSKNCDGRRGKRKGTHG